VVFPSMPITDGLGLNVTAFFWMRGVLSVVVVEVEAIVGGIEKMRMGLEIDF